VFLYDYNGRLVLSKVLAENSEVAVDYLPEGVYFIILKNGGKIVYSERVVKINSR
jgi:hypothetical protein